MQQPEGREDAQKRFQWCEIEEHLINGLPCSKSVRAFLMALWRIWNATPETERRIREDGSSLLDPKRETIAAELGKSIATVGRYSREAEETPYLESEPEPPNTTIYSIEWPMIFEHSDIDLGRARSMGFDKPRRRRRRQRRRLADEADRLKNDNLPAHFGDSTGSNSDTVAKFEPAQNCEDSDATPNTPPRSGDPPTGSHFAPTCKQHVNMAHVRHVVFKFFPQQPRSCEWPKTITKSDLGNPQAVEELYRIALAWGNVALGERMRLEFFAAAKRATRAQTPGAAFTSNVKNKRWGQSSNADEDWARSTIREIDREFDPPEFVEEELQDFGDTGGASNLPTGDAEERQREMAKLREWGRNRTVSETTN